MLYKDMSVEQKAAHYSRTEKYRKANLDIASAAARKYYHANKEKCAERAKNYRAENKELIQSQQRLKKRARKLEAIEYLGGCCQSCGQKYHPSVYEFHHIDPTEKEKDPSKMLMLSWLRLAAELDKCKLLGANCHRLEHYKDEY